MQRIAVYIIGALIALWLIGKALRYVRRPKSPRCNSCNDKDCPLKNKGE